MSNDNSSPSPLPSKAGDTVIKSDGCQPPANATSTGDDVMGGSEERGNLEASGLNEDDTAGGLFGARSAKRV